MPYKNLTGPKRAIFDWSAGKLKEVRNWTKKDGRVEIVEDNEAKGGVIVTA
jgi:hypothetical protein